MPKIPFTYKFENINFIIKAETFINDFSKINMNEPEIFFEVVKDRNFYNDTKNT